MKAIIYTLPNCKHCNEAKDILKEHGIPYEEFNLKDKENRAIRESYRALGAISAPVIIMMNDEKEWTMISYKKGDLINLLEGKV